MFLENHFSHTFETASVSGISTWGIKIGTHAKESVFVLR